MLGLSLVHAQQQGLGQGSQGPHSKSPPALKLVGLEPVASGRAERHEIFVASRPWVGGGASQGAQPQPPCFQTGDKCCLQRWTCLPLGFTRQIGQQGLQQRPVSGQPGSPPAVPHRPALDVQGDKAAA